MAIVLFHVFMDEWQENLQDGFIFTIADIKYKKTI